MNPDYNLPPEQRLTQRLVDQFNADERLWRKLEPRRRARRKLLSHLPEKQLKKLDLDEFAKERPPLECVGQRSFSLQPLSRIPHIPRCTLCALRVLLWSTFRTRNERPPSGMLARSAFRLHAASSRTQADSTTSQCVLGLPARNARKE
jgi:hypothetical protein